MKRHEREMCLLVGVLVGIICCLTSVPAGAKPQEEAKEQTIRLLVHYVYRVVSLIHRGWEAEFEARRDTGRIWVLSHSGDNYMEVAQVLVDVADQTIKALKPVNTQLLSQATDILGVLRQCTRSTYGTDSPVVVRAHLQRNERLLRLAQRELEQIGAAEPSTNISLASVTAFLLMQCQFAQTINKDFEIRFGNASGNDWLQLQTFFVHFYPEVVAIVDVLDDASRFLDEVGGRLKEGYVTEAKGVLKQLQEIYSRMKQRMDSYRFDSVRRVPPPDWSEVLSELSRDLPKDNRKIGQARKRVEEIKRLF